MLRYLAYGMRDLEKDPIPPMKRLNWEFYAILKGSCAPFIPGQASPEFQEHTLWVLPPHKLYGWQGNGQPFERIAFHFSTIPAELKDCVDSNDFFFAPLSRDQIDQIRRIATNIEPHWASPTPLSHLACEHLLLELTMIALHDIKWSPRTPLNKIDEERVERALTWYDIHMKRNPTVEEVAAAVHISSVHLRRLFKKVKNCTPHAAFRKLQIKRATDLLSTTSDTLEQVSRQCGFQSQSDFSRTFKNEMNTTANQWRTNIC